MNRTLEGIATVVGTIIGAGIFTLPVALESSGVIWFLVILILSAFASYLLTAYVGELAYTSKKNHQLPELISKYLGKNYKKITLILEEVTIIGALVAYFIGISMLLYYYVPKVVVYLILSILAIFISYGNFYALEQLETPTLIAKLVLIILFSAIVFTQFKPSNINVSSSDILESFGLLIFSMTSFTVIPEVKEELNNPKLLNKVLLISYLISATLYLIFSFSFAGAFGKSVSQIALQNLTGWLGIFGIIFGIFMMLTPLMTLSLAATDVLVFDFLVKRRNAAVIIGILPLFLSFFSKSFLSVIDIVGGIFLSILSFLILVAVINKRRKAIKGYYSVFGGNIALFFSLIFFLIAIVFTLISI